MLWLVKSAHMLCSQLTLELGCLLHNMDSILPNLLYRGKALSYWIIESVKSVFTSHLNTYPPFGHIMFVFCDQDRDYFDGIFYIEQNTKDVKTETQQGYIIPNIFRPMVDIKTDNHQDFSIWSISRPKL